MYLRGFLARARYIDACMQLQHLLANPVSGNGMNHFSFCSNGPWMECGSHRSIATHAFGQKNDARNRIPVAFPPSLSPWRPWQPTPTRRWRAVQTYGLVTASSQASRDEKYDDDDGRLGQNRASHVSCSTQGQYAGTHFPIRQR